MDWILSTTTHAGTLYLRDYRRGEVMPWTPYPRKAEKFTEEQAIVMARRLRYILKERIEPVRLPEQPRVQTCATLGCNEPVQPHREHCEAHCKPWVARPAVETISPEVDPLLTPQQETEGAFHAALDNPEFHDAFRNFLIGEDSDQAIDDVRAALDRAADHESLKAILTGMASRY